MRQTDNTRNEKANLPFPAEDAFAEKVWVKGLLLEIDPNKKHDCFHLSVLPADKGIGTPLWWSRSESITWAYWGARDPRADHKEIFSPEWIRNLISRPDKNNQLSGVYTFIGIDHKRKEAIVIGDRLGIQAVHFGKDESGALKISTHLMWLLWELKHPGYFDQEGFLSQVCYGYPIDPEQGLYQGAKKLAPGSYLKIMGPQCLQGQYWQEPGLSDQSQADISFLADCLRQNMNPPSGGIFLGLTAGKDSLCLASLFSRAPSKFLTGTFGADQCADRVQAAKIALDRGWEHRADGLCPAEEFADWASRIAFDSAGMTTCSYVDMARFIERTVPPGWSFVMGEGGECVRDFFQEGNRNPVERIMENYLTPYQYLEETLVPEVLERLDGYPENFLSPRRAAIPEDDDKIFAVRFYRQKRMTGNFSQRHGVLSTLRPKISPFLGNEFIDHSWKLSLESFRDSALHKKMIKFASPSSVEYFDNPADSEISPQDWPARFNGPVGREIFRLLSESLPCCANVFNPERVLNLFNTLRHKPDRGIYYLLRILSLTLAQFQIRNRNPIAQSGFRPLSLA